MAPGIATSSILATRSNCTATEKPEEAGLPLVDEADVPETPFPVVVLAPVTRLYQTIQK